MAKKQLHFQFYSDFICPWCYLGKVRIQRIREELTDDIDMHIQIMPYVLYPHIGPDGVPKSDFAKKTKPGMGRSLREEAKVEGIEFNYKLIDRIPYSFEAHRLVWIVQDPDLKYALSTQIFHDYFEKGQDISNLEYLKETGKAGGMPDEELGHFSEPSYGLDSCQQAITDAKNNNIHLVPTITFMEDLRIMGLQNYDVLKRYLIRAANLQKR